MKLSVVIPAYDERGTVGELLDRVLAWTPAPGDAKEIVVVEGGSTDGTRELVREYERRGGLRAIYEDAPRGKGAAVKRAWSSLSGDVLLVQDADLEYSVDDYAALLAPLREGAADVVLGSRALGPRGRRFRGRAAFDAGAAACTALFNALHGTSLTDGATMFKLFRRAALDGVTLEADGFDYDWELLAKACRRGCRIVERPVSYRPRTAAEGKKVRFWRDGARVLRAIVRWRPARSV